MPKNRSQDIFSGGKTAIETVGPVHQHFGLDDRDQPHFLTERRIARQGLRVRLDTAPGREAVVQCDHGAPFGKACADFVVVPQARAQSIQTFGHFLAGVAGKILGADIDLDPGNDPGIG